LAASASHIHSNGSNPAKSKLDFPALFGRLLFCWGCNGTEEKNAGGCCSWESVRGTVVALENNEGEAIGAVAEGVMSVAGSNAML
jgi:hypothetical protein